MSATHDLAHVDLNLLVAFDALAATSSVTQAARRVGVTQSAMSHTLRKLRGLFDDPLLVRVGAEMALTPRAQAIRDPVRAALVALGRVVNEPAGFDPATSRRTFRTVAPDLFDWLVLPALMPRLRARAPQVDLVVAPPAGPDLPQRLAAADLDLAIVPVAGWVDGLDGAALMRRTLFMDDYACFVRRGHPALDADGRLTLDAYLAATHVVVSPTGAGPSFVDTLLEAHAGRARRVALRVPGFALAPTVVARTDLVLTAPTCLVDVLAELPVRRVPLPFALPPHGIGMLWHRRMAADPGNVWLRQQIVEVIGEAPTPAERVARSG